MINLNEISNLFVNFNGDKITLLFASLVLLFVAFNLYRAHTRNHRQLQQLKSVKEDMRALLAASIGVGNRVRNIEKSQKKMHARQDEVALFEPANVSYEQAIQMAKNGNKVEDIESLCGLNHTEAELVYLMHHLEKVG